MGYNKNKKVYHEMILMNRLFLVNQKGKTPSQHKLIFKKASYWTELV